MNDQRCAECGTEYDTPAAALRCAGATEHIKFITVGFAELLANLPTVHCTQCGTPINHLSGVRTVGGDTLLCDDYCFADWADDQLADDDAQLALDYREDLDR